MKTKDLIVGGVVVPIALAVGANSVSASTVKPLESKIISFEKNEPGNEGLFTLEPDTNNVKSDIMLPDTASNKVCILTPNRIGLEYKSFEDTWTLFSRDSLPDAFFYHLENVVRGFIDIGNFTVNLGAVVEVASDHPKFSTFERHIANEKDIGDHRLALKFNAYNLVYKHNGLELTLGKYLHPSNMPNTERRVKHAGLMAKYSRDNLLGIDRLAALVSLHAGQNVAFEKGPGLYRIELSGYEVIGNRVKMNFNLGFTGYENANLGEIRLTNDPDAKFNIADFSLSFDMGQFKVGGMVSENFSADRGLSYNASAAFKFGKDGRNEVSLYHEMLQRNCAYDMNTGFAGPFTDYQLYAINTMFEIFKDLKIGPSVAWLEKGVNDNTIDWFNAFTFSLLYKLNMEYKTKEKN